MIEKENLHDEICKVLTWYEHPEEYPFAIEGETKEKIYEDIGDSMYQLLVKIDNELLT